MNNKILIGIILLLLVLSGYLLWQNQRMNSSIPKFTSAQESKCFSWTTYNSSVKSWHWRAEHLNEYFPTREDAVANCVVMLSGVTE